MQFVPHVNVNVYDWLPGVCGLCINQGGCCGHNPQNIAMLAAFPNLHIQSINQHNVIASRMQRSNYWDICALGDIDICKNYYIVVQSCSVNFQTCVTRNDDIYRLLKVCAF